MTKKELKSLIKEAIQELNEDRREDVLKNSLKQFVKSVELDANKKTVAFVPKDNSDRTLKNIIDSIKELGYAIKNKNKVNNEFVYSF